MIRIVKAAEYRFVVPGKAVSFRSHRAEEYKRKVRESARGLFKGPRKGSLDVRLDYFHTTGRRMDMDNISKCVLDSLTGLAYVDDQQVVLQSSVAHDLTTDVQIADGPVDLVKPLQFYSDYLFVRLRPR